MTLRLSGLQAHICRPDKAFSRHPALMKYKSDINIGFFYKIAPGYLRCYFTP